MIVDNIMLLYWAYNALSWNKYEKKIVDKNFKPLIANISTEIITYFLFQVIHLEC